jgi:hypothetical protein
MNTYKVRIHETVVITRTREVEVRLLAKDADQASLGISETG